MIEELKKSNGNPTDYTDPETGLKIFRSNLFANLMIEELKKSNGNPTDYIDPETGLKIFRSNLFANLILKTLEESPHHQDQECHPQIKLTGEDSYDSSNT